MNLDKEEIEKRGKDASKKWNKAQGYILDYLKQKQIPFAMKEKKKEKPTDEETTREEARKKEQNDFLKRVYDRTMAILDGTPLAPLDDALVGECVQIALDKSYRPPAPVKKVVDNKEAPKDAPAEAPKDTPAEVTKDKPAA